MPVRYVRLDALVLGMRLCHWVGRGIFLASMLERSIRSVSRKYGILLRLSQGAGVEIGRYMMVEYIRPDALGVGIRVPLSRSSENHRYN